MFQKIIYRLTWRRHYWRNVGFDELSELYTSMMFRSLAMSLVGIFIPIYLYELGHTVWEICLFFALMCFAWSVFVLPVAYIIAKYGPKHSMLASYVFQVITMLLLLSLKEENWPLPLIAILLAFSNCLFFSAFHVDFSKVKHKNHGGKELGWMFGMDKVGAILGPLIGGLVAYWAGSQYIFVVAVVVLFIGIVPLFLSSEPVATNQKIDFRNLKVGKIKWDLLSYAFYTIENNISTIVWPLFIGVFVFSDNPYAQLGAITSVSMFIAIFFARAIGKTIDKKKGRQLLRAGSVINAALHLFRPFTGNYIGALGINIANEAVTPMYRMAYSKGMYDAADDHPGNRIVYISSMEATNNFFKALFFFIFGLIAYFTADSKHVFTAMFITGAIASLGIMFERYRALKG